MNGNELTGACRYRARKRPWAVLEHRCRIGEINAISHSLAAGQSENLSGMNATGSVTHGAKSGPAACGVASVNRFPN